MNEDVRDRMLELGWSRGAAELVTQQPDDRFMAHMRKRLLGVKVPRRLYQTRPKAKISDSLRRRVFERDAYRCLSCGDWHNLSVDHIVPESKGGTLAFENLQTLCRSCNSRKGSR